MQVVGRFHRTDFEIPELPCHNLVMPHGGITVLLYMQTTGKNMITLMVDLLLHIG